MFYQMTRRITVDILYILFKDKIFAYFKSGLNVKSLNYVFHYHPVLNEKI